PAEPPPPPRNHQSKKPCSALPLPARQPAFFAYFLFGEKKVGRSGGAKAFDFDVKAFKAVDFEVEATFKAEAQNPTTPASKNYD
ncbi:hypothetical protein, partial [Cupriavidus sp. WS]|uniref:hypothetical protein n=1 Tax=Cupriavidus sp. WS TaxID=1312922 RepID=UPI001E4EDB8D